MTPSSMHILRGEQLEVWLADSADPESARYAVPAVWLVPADIDIRVLRVAVQKVVDRHPALRSRFTSRGGQVVREAIDKVVVMVPVVDIDAVYDEAVARETAIRETTRPFSLDLPPLLRVSVVRFRNAAVLCLSVHHLVADGWSFNIVAAELFEQYAAHFGASGEAAAPEGNGLTVADAGSPNSPAAYAAVQEYWTRLLAGAMAPTLPVDRIAEPGALVRTAALRAVLTPAQCRALAELCARERVTPLMVLVTGWAAVLRQWCGTDDLCIAIPFSGRSAPGTENTVDCLIRMLPVRVRMAATDTLGETLRAVRDQILDSLAHELVDVEQVSAALGHLISRFARSEVAHDHELPRRPFAGGEAVPLPLGLSGGKYPLTAAMTSTPDLSTVALSLDYDVAQFLPATGQLLLDQLIDVLTAMINGSLATATALLPAPGPAAHGRVRPEIPPAPVLVLQHGRERPDTPALRHGDRVVTYGALVDSAARLAHVLTHEFGVEPEAIVALALPRGIDAITMMLATNFAGAAYLPLDPTHPPSRLRAILADAAPVVLIGEAGTQLADLAVPCAVATIGELANRAATAPADTPADLHLDMLFNVLYTSGSTGRPKGVLLPYRGLSRLLGEGGLLPIDTDDVVAQLAPLNFDGATYEIWATLCAGATLSILPDEANVSPRELRDCVAAHGITGLLQVTPLLNRMIDQCPETLQRLRWVYFGGEMVSVAHLARVVAWCRSGTLVHSYGPTENSFTSTCLPIQNVDARLRTLGIGDPVPGTDLYVVRENTFDLVPVGAVGELLLGGIGLARGYLGQPGLTARRFVPDPFGTTPGGRLYRTGDLVRWNAAGALEFVTRTDNQVKIRSQRVELTEVEATLATVVGVSDCHVAVRVNGRGEKEIVGYAVAPAATSAAIRSALRAVLPEYMVPAHVVLLPEIPLNPNGKVDRARLPEPGNDQVSADASDRAGEALQHAVVDLPSRKRDTRTGAAEAPHAESDPVGSAWRHVLGTDVDIDPHVNFFDAGGHSLLIASLQYAIEERTGVQFKIADLLQRTTIDAQRALLAERGVELPATRASVPAERQQLPATAGGRSRDQGHSDEDVAIVGMGCRLPNSPNVATYWANLVAGVDCIVTGVAPTAAPSGWVPRWGQLDLPAGFDVRPFGLSPGAGDELDVQYRLLFETVWEAFEDAAVVLRTAGARSALYAGCADLAHRDRPAEATPTAYGAADALRRAFATAPTFLPTRLAYVLGLGGESMLVDTACSTGLVALQLALRSLRAGSCDYAVAAAVSVQSLAAPGYRYEPGLIYAADGLCRPFDQRGTGTVGGDGAAAVVLRRLGDARRDGDPVYAVIRGGAVNNDGRDRLAFSAPGLDGQVRVLRAALASAGLDGGDVDLVEAHGTGTRLGDAIEAAALAEAYGDRHGGDPLAITAAKSNIGHCNTVAGLAGLIKAALAVHHGYQPGTIHTGEPIEEVVSRSKVLDVLTTGRAWPNTGRLRRAAVSSFGIGGTNAHVILEQATGGDT